MTDRVTASWVIVPALRLRHYQRCLACRYDCAKYGNGPEVDATFGLRPPQALALRHLYMVCSASGSSTTCDNFKDFFATVAQGSAWDLLRDELRAQHVAMALRLHMKVGSLSAVITTVILWAAALGAIVNTCECHGVAEWCISAALQGLHWGGARTEGKKALIGDDSVL